MKVLKIRESKKPKLVEGTLPDIDTDFCSKDRAEIKSYMERRFGREQVCSVGTYSTLQMKGAIKDFSRTLDIDFSEANLITSILTMKDTTMFDLMKRCKEEPKLKAFVKDNSEIFYMIPSILGQPKTKGIHACALIVFPEIMKASSWAPMRSQKGLIVSEWGGGEMDDAGFLKDDILGIKQLDKFDDILSLIKKNGKKVPDIYNLPHCDEVFRYFTNGWNGDVFQMGSSGLTSYTKELKPTSIHDLIAANALYRPGPMENGYHKTYAKCKNEGKKPEYLWGTENITKDTFGLIVYQEQVMQTFVELGGLNLKEADDVRRAMGKKKLSVLLPWKERVKKGFLERGATSSEFEKIWSTIEEFAKYSFNKSHSAAYALTGYICQWLKVNFPIEYWTVALNYADDEKALSYLSEILQSGKILISSPDINGSGISMTSNQNASTIYWGIESIKGIGEDTAIQIVEERKLNGEYKSFADFFFRHNFKGSKVKKQTYEALITCGAFDKLYGFGGSEERRMLLINRYRKFKRVKISNPKRDIYINGEVSQNWWWKLQQKNLTNLAFIDYESLCKEADDDVLFAKNLELSRKQIKPLFRSFGGYVVECKERRSKKGSYAKLIIENNYKLYNVLVWADQYSEFKPILKNCEKSLIVFSGDLKYDGKWANENQFTVNKSSFIKVF